MNRIPLENARVFNLGSRVVNNYLISRDDGCILIDTGYENGFRAFLRKLKNAGVSPGEIRYVFLTHAHDDHAGFLNRVLEITPAQVILHPKAVKGLKRGQNSFEGGCSGALAWFFCQVLALFGKGSHRYPPIREEFLSRLIPIDSPEFRALALPFSVIETPGHTSDHISALMGRVLFCGDAAMNGFPSRNRVIIWIDDLKQFKSSWEKILTLGADTICPAHGKPFPASDLRRFLPTLERVRLFPLTPRRKKGADARRD